METNYYSEEYNEKGLHLTQPASDFLKEVAKWAKFLSILGFIGLALMVIASFFIGTAMANMPDTKLPIEELKWIVPVIYVIIAIIHVFPIYYLYKFSVHARTALDLKNSDTLTEAFRFLKSHYKFVGILIIIVICVYAIAIVGAVIAGIASLMYK